MRLKWLSWNWNIWVTSLMIRRIFFICRDGGWIKATAYRQKQQEMATDQRRGVKDTKMRWYPIKRGAIDRGAFFIEILDQLLQREWDSWEILEAGERRRISMRGYSSNLCRKDGGNEWTGEHRSSGEREKTILPFSFLSFWDKHSVSFK